MQYEIDVSSEFDMVVRRSHMLRDALQRMQKVSFDPRKKLNVIFNNNFSIILLTITYFY